MKRTLLSVFATVILSSTSGHAATVYTSGTLGSPANAFYSDPDGGAWQASQLTVAAAVSIDSLVFDGFYISLGTMNTFDIVVMAAGSLPGSVVASVSGVTATRTQISGSYYQFSATIGATPIVLEPGTYWLSIANVAGDGVWGWATSAGAGIAAGSDISQTSGYTTGGTKLFNYSLGGTVIPEPSALLLGSLGASALIRRRRNA